MEDLIWRYIDGDCTESEMMEVKARFANDPDFLIEYQDALALNQMLTQASVTPLDQNFKKQLNTKVFSTVSKQSKVVLFPRSWIFGLVALAAMGIVVALRFQGSESSYLVLPQLDEKSISMITWVLTSFLVLIGLDEGFRQWLTFRRHTHLNLL